MKRVISLLISCVMVMTLLVGQVAAAGEQWEQHPDMIGGRYQFCTVSVDKKIYVLGGVIDGSGPRGSSAVYDTESKTWTEIAQMPTTHSFTTGCLVGRKAYVFETDNGTRNTYIYDIDKNTWESGEPLPETVDRCYAVSKGNTIYLFTTVGQLWTYDVVNKVWDTSRSVPGADYFTSICADNENIYYTGNADYRQIYAYNFSTEQTSEVAQITRTVYDPGFVAHNQKLYVISGQDPNVKNLPNVEIYDLKTQTWASGPNTAFARVYMGTAVVDGRIYTLGGSYYNKVESLYVGGATPTPTGNRLSVLLNISEAVQLSTTFDLADNADFTWSSTNTAVATVDAAGKVTAVGEGTADIYATSADGSFREFIPVKVLPGTADEYRLAVHLTPNETKKLYVTENASAVTWSSMDSTVATVSNTGVVTGVANGLAIIKATYAGQEYQIYIRVA